ncbi:GNAT family N-acetyltransferase [Streptomyces sp. N2-109]|uniref:GNAT family N-acetyltransferase n=1 Tax=Streptomyces gossypii TaxID=2883101 RepID=A0ABT2JQ83_9ACTN|nr:GNAT family N-acetyltransferase [Streptomyces gossypii]MCT2590048.1 GNAT family N-acetyltransferase [Streptomyces gossypii]
MPQSETATGIRLALWSKDDLDLLHQVNTPEMRAHLGGPEREEQILSRHERYLQPTDPGVSCMFRIALLPDDESAGIIGYWEREWQGETVYETGWGVLPHLQGRGIAVAAAVRTIAAARAQRRHARIHAFPSTGNPASNAICRKAGFTLSGQCDLEYPPETGNIMHCNDWSLDLTDPAPPPPPAR